MRAPVPEDEALLAERGCDLHQVSLFRRFWVDCVFAVDNEQGGTLYLGLDFDRACDLSLPD